ncbi:ATP-dependent helicase C-terminal domain-containing protein [Actinomadura madurae]|uniref:ATP-dependent helicase C-terminal domain-containing protein n=1 Tax=Actinomadura madurae TaxID=1993 RepID=UPI0020D21F28|nr:ATP-dependent helicase C-terminal domain-containing protein [Actinomadura madurae]MCP9977893.1 ATP-dependent helicase HrpB [Actinomadura madurae]
MQLSAAETLPVRHAVPALRAALDGGGTAVLAAPPGTGKTTLVPLALAGLALGGPPAAGKVLVLEPRRLAARAAARRMAWLLGERVGGRVGVTVRGESRPGSRVEVVTTGVVLQRLQSEPDLPGVGTVILDECHERHLDADTALAFLLDVRATVRPDLRLVAASATADTGPWSRLLGGAPVVETEAALHPVETIWAPPPRPVAPPHGMRVDPAFLAHVAATVRRAAAERDGDVLCFLPGTGEIARVAGMLAGAGADVLQIHGQAPRSAQDEVLAPSSRRRIVLATSVAESSLTVPGVRTVVDSGLAREPRTDHARGLGSLTTVRASRATAAQRAGRAGREAPGAVYRCWTAAEHDRLPARPRPEIELADLAGFALQAACWGDPDASGLALPDPPPPAAMDAARATLRALGAVSSRGGRPPTPPATLWRTGASPAGAAGWPVSGCIRASPAPWSTAPGEVGARAAAEVVALLSEPPPRAAGRRPHRRLARPAPPRPSRRRPRRPLAGRDRPPGEGARLLGSGGPAGRGGRGRPGGRDRGGPGVPGAGGAQAGRRVSDGVRDRGRPRGRVGAGRGAAGVARGGGGGPPGRVGVGAGAAGRRDRRGRGAVRRGAAARRGRGGRVAGRGRGRAPRRAARRDRAGRPAAAGARPGRGAGRAAGRGPRRGAGTAHLDPGGRRAPRAARVPARCPGEPWPAVDDAALLERAPEWLAGARRRADLARVDVAAVLRGLLPWEQAARLDEYAPERIEVPSGSRIRVGYSGERPVLAVKLQELFGWDAVPRLAGGRVPLVVHLLSPAGRPAAVTADLASFWREGYKAVRAELRGRYPKHPWPEDPAGAVPTKRTKRASGS